MNKKYTSTIERPILKRGSTGIFVNSLQTELKMLGYYKGEVTGEFDLATEHAVKMFQADKGLVIDGIVGPKTWTMLDRAIEKISGKKEIFEEIFTFIRQHPLLVGSLALSAVFGGLYLILKKRSE